MNAEAKRLRKWLRWQHKKSCPRKIQHATKESALAHVDRLVNEQGEQRAALTIYPCLVCGKLHVGHTPLFLPEKMKKRRR